MLRSWAALDHHTTSIMFNGWHGVVFLLLFFGACIAAVVKWRHWSIMTSNVHTIREKQQLLSSVSFGEPLPLHFVRWRSLLSPRAKELPAFPLFQRILNHDWCCVTMGWVAPPWCRHSDWSNDIEQGCQTNFTLRPHTAHICTVLRWHQCARQAVLSLLTLVSVFTLFI